MNELIQQARDLCSESTDAPWKIHNTPDYTEIQVRGGRDAGFSPVALADEIYNANFIAASRTLVPQLCDALEAAEKELIDYHHTQKTVDGKMSENARLRKINEQLTARVEKAEAERDTYRAALQNWHEAGDRP